jgi:hypothetical protein
MTEKTDNLVLNILRDIPMCLARMEERLTSLELRMTAQEQLLGTLVTLIPASYEHN